MKVSNQHCGPRRARLSAALLIAAMLLGAASLPAAEGDPLPPDDLAKETLVFAATRQADGAHGILSFWLQTKNLPVSQNITLVPIGLAAETPAPVYLEVDATRRLVITIDDVDEFDGAPGGSVSSFAVQAETGTLELLNRRSSMGAHPCRLALDEQAGRILVANCGNGKIAVFPIETDGKLGEPTSVVAASGASCITLDPARRFAFVCDSASNRVQAFRYDSAAGALTAAGDPVQTSAGTGASRLVFRPDGRFAYVLDSNSSTVTAFSYDPEAGALTETQNLSTVPPYYDGPNTATELAMHPGGKFLYAANNGHNSIVLFNVGDSGELSYVEEQGVGGKNPMHFGIQPSAKHLAITNHDTNALLVSRIDAGNGRLKPSGVFAAASAPTVIQFLPPAE